MYFDKNKKTNIYKLINNKYKFFAHTYDKKDLTHTDNIKSNELLTEHIDRCLNYFYLIVKNKKLDEVFLRLEKIFLSDEILDNRYKEIVELFREMILNTITLHDIGKINPIYQDKIMKNPILNSSELAKYIKLSSNHSFLSSLIYIKYYYSRLKELSDDISISTKRKIRTFILLNSYIISKHHGSLSNFYEYILKVSDMDNDVVIVDNELLGTNQDLFLLNKFKLNIKIMKNFKNSSIKFLDLMNENESVHFYTYQKLLFSILVACDYYATSEFKSNVSISDFGQINEIKEFYDIYKDTEINKSIRDYKKIHYKKSDIDFERIQDINILRNEIFIECEENLIKNLEESVFFIEAPTGSGKTNISINLSFKLIEEDKRLHKIFYVYPFNTLIEQNIKNLNSIFENNKNLLDKISVVNSTNPIKQNITTEKEESRKEESSYYNKLLLDRQFLNYPIVLTTHVSLFNTMFNSSRESSFGFYQLANSVIILDEIQCYRNAIWTEIIMFLRGFAKVLNIKVIIMSATLPDLNLLLRTNKKTINLIENKDKYYTNKIFKDRVKMKFDLLDENFTKEKLYHHVLEQVNEKKKILIEFISKKSSYEFFEELKQAHLGCRIELITGDDNIIERNRILESITSPDVKANGMILVSTQVIEAGVDIDMDIGYKDISILDNEEQFMGRINRSCKRTGEVYFFNLDNSNRIYKDDYRSNKEFSLLNKKSRDILQNKQYQIYYKEVMDLLKIKNNELNENNIESFFKNEVSRLNANTISERMKLIEDDKWSIRVFLCTEIKIKQKDSNIGILDGKAIWDSYKNILNDNDMEYAKKQIKLSIIKSKMNYFIYQIKVNDSPCYNDQIGDIYCIYDGKEYFKNGKLDREKFITNIGEFI